MGKKEDAFPSRWFKVADFPQPRTLKMTDAHLEPLPNKDGDMEDKWTVGFAGERKRLVCNSGNFDLLVDITGEDDWDNWGGHRVTLYKNRELAFGKLTDCLRVRAPNEPPKTAAPALAPKAAPPSDDIEVDDNEPPPHTEAPPFNDDVEL